MKIATVVGTRPQFIKAMMVSKAVRKNHDEILIHTGQHCDANMSQVFFSGRGCPAPDYYIDAGLAAPGRQLAKMFDGLKAVFEWEKPDVVVVYGDSRSTLAGALAASKTGIPLAHVEAGLRCGKRAMPEEFIRELTDYLSAILFCPSEIAVRNLNKEGIINGNGAASGKETDTVRFRGSIIVNVGDVMYDALQECLNNGNCSPPSAAGRLPEPGEYLLATVHRAENADKKERLSVILESLVTLGEKVVFPVHPRTMKRISEFNLGGYLAHPNMVVIDPAGYDEMIWLCKNARKIITDSGGVQKEAFYLRVPCITLREETEWTETVERGCNVLVGCDRRLILEAVGASARGDWSGSPYGQGNASWLISRLLEEYFCPR
ncbi:UDP-N-acetylglucosamine 2-epimerase (non-hydrolyzing) [Pelotomaculum isophthalicicum JI]|uniref:UDP-N-acetylglucosamine 2-epimerase (Non-hydrolyzing) n=1 Tax=Pelotomaculum isophthalicicum JI TaxID=947010 RepID=A0A9X4H1U2_9FIRM|nr:UDP-N-acetylglucosamine 2-epimerase (non-hydrolyzing) [Pelotomaculum isophthalicicum]MDF9407861.1 UDP-N-acetylglucosamine 2-epimerase (non-hydrolyzing) [Pelotomaculum isophthalicicum JI]